MSAADDRADVPPFAELAALAEQPPGAARDRLAENQAYHDMMALGGDEVSCYRVRSAVLDLKLLRAGHVDSIMRQVRKDAELGAEGQGAAPAAAPARPASLPAGLREVPGSPGFGYRPADPDHPGELWEQRGRPLHWHKVLGWAPAVTQFLETPSESGNGATAYYYTIAAAGRQVTADGAELAAGEPWKVLPVSGYGAKRIREVLANVVLAEAAELAIGRALTRTGWHRDDAGERFYVHADGRASDGRDVVLVGREDYPRLAAAARPAPELGTADIAAALGMVAERGGGPALAGLGIGVRALAHSLHRVPGGFIAVGKPNAGKSSLGWHARCVSVAREDRADNWPPLASATFGDTKTSIEAALDYEADMPALLDDAALTDKSGRAELAEVTGRLEMVYRALANDTRVRGRMDRTMLPRPSRYVRSPVIATIQGTVADIPVQNSLLRRVALLPVARGEIDLRWYREGGGTGLVAPLRALGEHLVIGYLAALGDGAPGYVAAKDAEARAMLAASLDVIVPGWDEHAEGLAGVADIMACALGGLLIAAEVCNLAPAALTLVALPYLASAVAEQAARMSDTAAEATPAEALGEILRAALLDGRAHVRDHQGDAAPAIEGLTEQEQGLERLGADPSGLITWRGRGVPLYYLPEAGALGVRADSLHKLIRASGDTRIPLRTPRTLPAYLVTEGAALPSTQKTGGGTHQKRIGGASGDNLRLVYLRSDLIHLASTENDAAATATTATTATPQVSGGESNGSTATPSERTATPQVRGIIEAAESAPAMPAPPSENDRDLACSGCSGSDGSEPLHGRALCRACNTVMSPWLRENGAEYHVGCAPDGAYQAFAEGLGHAPPRDAAEAARHLSLVPPPAAPVAAELGERQGAAPARAEASALPPPAVAESGPRRRWAVLGGDGRAYASGGEVITLAEGAVEACRGSVGDLAALAESLGVLADPPGALYVPAEAREALGLPAVLSGALSKWGDMPHMWVEAADPARWYVPEGAGLGRRVPVYRRAADGARTYAGVAVAFPEWIEAAPSLGPLPAAELAAALDLIHQGTTYGGGGNGGVEFAHSPAATFGRLVDKRLRWSRKGRPEPVTLPPPYDRSAKRPRGAPAPLRPPGAHAAPPAEIPEGWTVARLDVRSCYPSAGIGTDFGLGAAEHRQGGELGKQPGAYLVRVSAGAAAHESLTPFVPAVSAGRAREVLAWLDSHAARWLAECGVPLEVVESWTWPESQRVFASADADLTAARKRYQAGGSVPELAAAEVLKSMPNTFLGGWLASDFGGDRQADDWRARYDWWLAIKTQAEVRKQRNLLPAVRAGAVRVLASQQIDSVYLAAPSLADIEAMPGTGGRPAVAEGNGKFKIEAHAPVGAELAAVLASAKDGHVRRRAIASALETGE